MKRSTFTLLILLVALISAKAQTPGTLTVTTTTSTAGGNFAPKNIVAIWIEDDQGNFVKTLLAYAQTRKTHLNTWEANTTAAGSPFNVVDAITGATRSSHGTRTCTWNGTDVDGNIVADGTYHVWMELTDKNSTGNFSSFSFEKDTVDVDLTPLNVPSFSAISIVWDPVMTAVEEFTKADDISVFPNPSSGIFSIVGNVIEEAAIYNTSGALIENNAIQQVDLTGQPDGVYILKIRTGHGLTVRHLIKKTR